MRKSIRMCDLCNNDGDENEATAWYRAPGDNQDYDICKKHKKEVENCGIETNDYETN